LFFYFNIVIVETYNQSRQNLALTGGMTLLIYLLEWIYTKTNSGLNHYD